MNWLNKLFTHPSRIKANQHITLSSLLLSRVFSIQFSRRKRHTNSLVLFFFFFFFYYGSYSKLNVVDVPFCCAALRCWRVICDRPRPYGGARLDSVLHGNVIHHLMRHHHWGRLRPPAPFSCQMLGQNKRIWFCCSPRRAVPCRRDCAFFWIFNSTTGRDGWEQ